MQIKFVFVDLTKHLKILRCFVLSYLPLELPLELPPDERVLVYLFDFIQSYNFPKELSFVERVTIFCQLVSQYEKSLQLTETTASINGIEYLLIYNK